MGALWSQARSCGVAEVFIFSHTMKEILQNSLQLPFWNRLSALCGAFASSLQFESGRLYDFDCLEEFTQSHDHFLEECFFSAFLDTQRDDQDTPEADLSPSLHTVQLTFFKLLKYVEVVEECVRLANVTVDRWGQQERERKATDSEKKATKDKKEQLMRRVRAVAVQHLQLAKRDTELLSHTLYSMNDTLYRVADRRHRSGTNRDSESWEERTSYLSHVTLLLNDVIKSLV
ncbi:hypothetical protein AGDE_13274 [Angomonas deanei]|nr:hypothetical protein AGDE_13274 [Angomonas deanei]|eukprot:EPY22489.1 hypothetical protein AGDE_13274 [Angomonas deanei]